MDCILTIVSFDSHTTIWNQENICKKAILKVEKIGLGNPISQFHPKVMNHDVELSQKLINNFIQHIQ